LFTFNSSGFLFSTSLSSSSSSQESILNYVYKSFGAINALLAVLFSIISLELLPPIYYGKIQNAGPLCKRFSILADFLFLAWQSIIFAVLSIIDTNSSSFSIAMNVIICGGFLISSGFHFHYSHFIRRKTQISFTILMASFFVGSLVNSLDSMGLFEFYLALKNLKYLAAFFIIAFLPILLKKKMKEARENSLYFQANQASDFSLKILAITVLKWWEQRK